MNKNNQSHNHKNEKQNQAEELKCHLEENTYTKAEAICVYDAQSKLKSHWTLMEGYEWARSKQQIFF